MKKIDLGQTISILANVGVILGIVFLAIQVNQNNALLRNEARYNLHLDRTQEIEQMALEPELAAIWEKVSSNEPLSAVEERRYTASLGARWVRWEWYYEQYRDGLIAEDVLPVKAWKNLFEDNPAMRNRWMTNRDVYTPEFVRWLEENVIGAK